LHLCLEAQYWCRCLHGAKPFDGDTMHVIGLLILILDIYVIYQVLKGPGEAGMKLVWVIVVLLLPLLGPILYMLFGRGR
jgi:hypothetical protein